MQDGRIEKGIRRSTCARGADERDRNAVRTTAARGREASARYDTGPWSDAVERVAPTSPRSACPQSTRRDCPGEGGDGGGTRGCARSVAASSAPATPGGGGRRSRRLEEAREQSRGGNSPSTNSVSARGEASFAHSWHSRRRDCPRCSRPRRRVLSRAEASAIAVAAALPTTSAPTTPRGNSVPTSPGPFPARRSNCCTPLCRTRGSAVATASTSADEDERARGRRSGDEALALRTRGAIPGAVGVGVGGGRRRRPSRGRRRGRRCARTTLNSPLRRAFKI